MSVMGWRDFLGMLGTAAAWPSLAFGQQQPVPVVGFVGFAAIEIDSATLVPFRRAMADLGYVEGRSIIVEARPPICDTCRRAQRKMKARSRANGSGIAARTVALIHPLSSTWIKSDAVSAV